MEHLIALIDSLVWPVALVWIGYLFRKEVRGLIGRVSQLKYKGAEAHFEKVINTIDMKPRLQATDAAVTGVTATGSVGGPTVVTSKAAGGEEGRESADSRVSEAMLLRYAETSYSAEYDDKYRRLLRFAEASQSAALIEAWELFESSLLAALFRLEMDPDIRDLKKYLPKLYEQGYVARDISPDYDGLRELRNEAVHRRLPEIDAKLIRRYLQIAIERCITLDNLEPRPAERNG